MNMISRVTGTITILADKNRWNIIDDLVKSHIPPAAHASTGSARTEYQSVTPFALSLSKGDASF
jgi:hypothetical protein